MPKSKSTDQNGEEEKPEICTTLLQPSHNKIHFSGVKRSEEPILISIEREGIPPNGGSNQGYLRDPQKQEQTVSNFPIIDSKKPVLKATEEEVRTLSPQGTPKGAEN